ncbi:MAG: FAD:protein FMN transferase [Planctomycetota bacterium]
MAAKPQSNRRQFLTGQAALDAVSNLGADASPQSLSHRGELARGEAQTYLIQIERRAMACEFQVLLNAGQNPGATEAALDAMDVIERLEDQLSWFRDTSELTRINRTAAASPVIVEHRLFQLLAEAISLSEQTGGAFDITAGPLWKLWGFNRREGKVPSEADIQQTLEQTGSRHVHLASETQTIQFARDGVELNLGAIGKGYALDRCAEHLVSAGVEAFLIHGGQSSMLARGSRSGLSETGPCWTVALRHPLKPDQRLAEIYLRDRALGTSGSGNQFFHFGGRRYGHVLDPRTGWPADDLLSATVLAPTAAQADALATGFFVMGLDSSLEFCRSRPELGALLVSAGEQAGSLELATIGLNQNDWRRLR